MPGKAMALLLALGVTSAASGLAATYAAWGWGERIICGGPEMDPQVRYRPTVVDVSLKKLLPSR